MVSYPEKLYHILKVIDTSSGPLGSCTISQLLNARDLPISEATVGRLLRRCDGEGWTEKKGFQGRVLTQQGQQKLQEWEIAQRQERNTNRFVRLTRVEDKEELVSILVARRAIEREIARLAAINAGKDDIDELKAIIHYNWDRAERGLTGAQEDVAYHKTLARIAGNKILEAALEMIRQEAQLSPILEKIRHEVGSRLVDDHIAILEAIEKGHSQEAEEAMVRHIEGIIDDVNTYWASVEREEKGHGS